MSRFEFSLDLFLWLLSTPGQQLLAHAQQLDLRPAQQLKTLAALRVQSADNREHATAAYEMAVLRQHARTKFLHADQMYFTREALEQASGNRISIYRARRFANFHALSEEKGLAPSPRFFAPVSSEAWGRAGVGVGAESKPIYDLACSIGGDLFTLATHSHVVGIDRDPVRLAMAAANAVALGLSAQVELVEADLEQFDPPPCAGIFFDPARRDQGRRLSAAAYQPALTLIERWLPLTQCLGAKVAPGIQAGQVPLRVRCEVEFISVDGELKEAVLWYGAAAQPGQRATLLQGDQRHTLHSTDVTLSRLPISPPQAFVYEPDPTILRAYLVEAIGAQLHAAQLDPDIAYLTAEHFTPTPFARCWRVVEWLPFQLKNLRAVLRRRGVGAVTVKKRGSPIDTDALARELSGEGDWPCVVFLTQHLGKPIAIVAEGPV